VGVKTVAKRSKSTRRSASKPWRCRHANLSPSVWKGLLNELTSFLAHKSYWKNKDSDELKTISIAELFKISLYEHEHDGAPDMDSDEDFVGHSDSKLSKYYDILGVPEGSSFKTAHSAYKKLALVHHPDKGGDPEKFKQISEAIDALENVLVKGGGRRRMKRTRRKS